jgi:MFS transporter, SET family, sugar efflux transporter
MDSKMPGPLPNNKTNESPEPRQERVPLLSGLHALLGTPFILPVTIAVLFIGAGDAVGGSYLTLFAVDHARMSPLRLGIFLTVQAVNGIAVSTVFGRWFDRRASVVPVLLALVMTTVGYLLLTATTRFYLLLVIAGGPLAASLAGFPQLFALVKGHLDQGGAETAERGIATIRATWSIAWAIGPALGAVVISRFDFRGVFMTAALCAAVAMILVAAVRVPIPSNGTRDSEVKLTSRVVRQTRLVGSSLILFHMAMFMGSIALPIVATHELRGTKADVGLIFSVCAFLEVLVMFAFLIRPSKAGKHHWISLGFLAFVLYFLVATWSPSVVVLLIAQVLRAVGIGLIGYQGISYIQALMPNQVGSAAALFSNTTNAGFLLSGLTAGAWAHVFGYRSMFMACAVLSGLGLLTLHFQLGAQSQRVAT